MKILLNFNEQKIHNLRLKFWWWERIKIIDTKFSRLFQIVCIGPKCVLPKSICLKTNFGTYLEFLFPAVAEKFLGEVDLFCIFFALPAKDGLTK
jgi:hypothetical protein